jgi:hypothetical protein
MPCLQLCHHESGNGITKFKQLALLGAGLAGMGAMRGRHKAA